MGLNMITKNKKTSVGKKLWDIFKLKIDNYMPDRRIAKYGLGGKTLMHNFKETDSRCSKLV